VRGNLAVAPGPCSRGVAWRSGAEAVRRGRCVIWFSLPGFSDSDTRTALRAGDSPDSSRNGALRSLVT
jgi:hypothetical protein